MTCVVASAVLPPKLQFAEYHWCNRASRCNGTLHSAGWLDVFHEGEETFGEGGVDVHGAFQKRVGLIRKHEGAEDLHQLAAFGGKDGSSKNTIVGRIDDDLHEASGFAALDGARHIGHRAPADF